MVSEWANTYDPIARRLRAYRCLYVCEWMDDSRTKNVCCVCTFADFGFFDVADNKPIAVVEAVFNISFFFSSPLCFAKDGFFG